MRFPKVVALLLTLLPVFGSVGAQAETLQEAVQFMLKSNPDVKAGYHSRQAVEHEVEQAKSGYLPSLDYVAGIGVYDVYEPADDTGTPRIHTLSLRQNVYNGLATVNEVKRQEARLDSSEYLLHGTAENTALKVVKVFINVLRSLELNELAKENLLIHQRIYDQIKLRSESGVDDKASYDHVQGRLALAQSNVVVTEINLLDAQTNYQAVVGRFPKDLVVPQSLEASLPVSLEEAQGIAVDNHPILKSAAADLKARRAQDEVAKSPFRPIVDIEVDRNWKDDVDPYLGWREDMSAMLRLRFNLFHGWRDKERKAETSELLMEAQAIEDNTYRMVVESIRLSWNANKAVQDKLGHIEDYVNATSATAEAFSKQWSIGKRTMLDVLDTEAEVINAKKDLIGTKYDGLYAQCRVLNGIGRLVHTLGLKWPGENVAQAKHSRKNAPVLIGSVSR